MRFYWKLNLCVCSRQQSVAFLSIIPNRMWLSRIAYAAHYISASLNWTWNSIMIRTFLRFDGRAASLRCSYWRKTEKVADSKLLATHSISAEWELFDSVRYYAPHVCKGARFQVRVKGTKRTRTGWLKCGWGANKCALCCTRGKRRDIFMSGTHSSLCIRCA